MVGVLVVCVEVLLDRGDEVGHAVEDAAADGFVGEFSEPALYEVQPGAGCRREVQVKPGVLLKPFVDGVADLHNHLAVVRIKVDQEVTVGVLSALVKAASLKVERLATRALRGVRVRVMLVALKHDYVMHLEKVAQAVSVEALKPFP